MGPRSLLCSTALLVVAAAGCGPASLSDVQVAGATISVESFGGAAALVGVTAGNGLLVVEDVDGTSQPFDVSLAGPSMGVLLQASSMSEEPLFGETFNVTLALPPDRTLRGDELLGSYVGTSAGAHLVLGGEEHTLKNGAGVELRASGWSLGLGLFAGFEWLGVSAEER
jgi:hypothetical protein